MNAASFTLHTTLTPKLDTVPSERSLLAVVSPTFFLCSTRRGPSRRTCFVGNRSVLAFSKGQSSQRVRKQGKVTRFPAA